MGVYMLLAFVLLLFMKTNNSKIVLGLFILFFFVSAFRGFTVGTDTLNYYDLYRGYAVSTRLDPGFALLFMGLRAVGVPYRVVLIVLSLAMFSILYVFTRKEKTSPVLLLLFFFLLGYCFSFYNVTRQLLASGVLLFAYKNRAEKGNIYLFFLYIIIAAFFHKTALIGVVILFLDRIKIPGAYIILLLPFTFIFPMLIPTNEIINYLTSNIGFLNMYDVYTDGADKQLFSVNRLAMNVFYMYLAHKYEDSKNDIYFSACILGLIILNLFAYSGVITRLAVYFQFAQIIFLTNYYNKYSQVDKALVIAYSLVIFLFTMKNNIGGIVPYTFGGF